MFKIISKREYEVLSGEWEEQNKKIDRLTASRNKYHALYEESLKEKNDLLIKLTKANFEIKDLKKQLEKVRKDNEQEVI